MAHDVFISYSTKDKVIADAVCAKLEENKIRAWIAPRDVPAGTSFAGSIISAINKCKMFILIWSENINQSEHILSEINRAFDQGITIIPFRIQDVMPTDEMSYYLGRTHWLDAIDPPVEKHISSLIDTVNKNLGRETDSKTEYEEAASSFEAAPVIHKKTEKKPKETKRSTGEREKTWIKEYLPFILIGIVAVVMMVLYFSGVLNKSGPDGSSVDALMTERAMTETVSDDINQPTSTVSSEPEWISFAEEYSEQIIAALDFHEPDIEKYFSEENPDVNYFVYFDQINKCPNPEEAAANHVGGAFELTIGPNCKESSLVIDNLNFQNFVLQTEIDFSQAPNVSFEFRNPGQAFFIRGDGNWQLGDTMVAHEGNNKNFGTFDPSNSVEITIIARGQDQLVLLDSIPISFYQNRDLSISAENWDFLVSIYDTEEVQSIFLDRMLVWNIDEMGLLGIDDIEIHGDNIRYKIMNYSPDYSDDFTELRDEWEIILFDEQYRSGEGCPVTNVDDIMYEVVGDVLRLKGKDECRQTHISNPSFIFKSFAAHFEVHDPDEGASINFIIQHLDENIEEPGLTLQFNDSHWEISTSHERDVWISKLSGEITNGLVDSQGYGVDMVFLDQVFYFMVNEELMAYYDTSLDEGTEYRVFMHVLFEGRGDGAEQINIDDFMIWDLEKYDFLDFELSHIADDIFADIESREPDFEDDFSIVDPTWSFNQYHDYDCEGLLYTEQNITNGSMIVNTNKDCPQIGIHHDGLSFEDYVLQMNVDFQQTDGSITIEHSYPGENFTSFTLHSDGQWNFNKVENEMVVESFTDYADVLDISKSVTITIIDKTTNILIYINSNLLISIKKEEVYSGEPTLGFHIQNFENNLSDTKTFTINNIKIWELGD